MSSPRLQEFFLGERTCTSSSTVLERGNEKSYNQWKVKYMNNQVLGPLLKEDSTDPLIYEHWRGRILDLLEEWPSNVPDSEFDNLDIVMPDYKPETIGKIQHQWALFNPKPKTFYFKNEEKLIFSFCEYLRQAGVDMLRGHNINAFDIPYIQQRINVLNIRQTKYFPARANYPISMGRANFLLKSPIPSLREDTVSKKVTVTKASNEVVHIIPDIPGVDYLDTLPWARKEIQPKLKHHTLSYIAQVLVKDQKFDVPGSSISHLFINDLKRLRDYLEQDVALTQRCSNVQNATTFAFMFARLVGAIQICELYNSGVQRMINAILMRTLMKEGLNKVVADDNPFSIGKEIEIEWEENDEEIDVDGTNPKKKKKKEKGYKGATCIDPLKGLLIAIWLCWDFSALYPTIMISHGISHDLMGTISHFKKLGIGVDRLWHTGEKFLNPKTGKDEEWYFLQKRKRKNYLQLERIFLLGFFSV
jgi:DNA polymerase elongation subunit (family B)